MARTVNRRVTVSIALLLGTTLTCAAVAPVGSAVADDTARVVEPDPTFSAPLDVDNDYFPLEPGTQFVYEGEIIEDGVSIPHKVTFTITDLTKVVDGVKTIVVYDRDFTDGELVEQELAFFAEDDQENVWNFGEYPEEYEGGVFTGAPSTWVRGTADAYGGVHVLSEPQVGDFYVEAQVPSIDFFDTSLVTSLTWKTNVPAGSFRNVQVVRETSPNDPDSGFQLKYYAPDTGLARVRADGGGSQENLELVKIRHLTKTQLGKTRDAVLAMDRRGYKVVPDIYGTTGKAKRR